jgi:hypothetical protein
MCHHYSPEWETDAHPVEQMIFGKQDTHVPREGRDLIRKELEDASVIASVCVRLRPGSGDCADRGGAVFGGASATRVY